MKTSIILFSICALTVIAVGAGLGPADPAALAAQAASVAPAQVEASVPTRLDSPRTVPMRILPTITVIASSADLAAADAASANERSVMFEVAADSADQAIVQPLRASLQRARLGNPFYDFGRINSVPAAAE